MNTRNAAGEVVDQVGASTPANDTEVAAKRTRTPRVKSPVEIAAERLAAVVGQIDGNRAKINELIDVQDALRAERDVLLKTLSSDSATRAFPAEESLHTTATDPEILTGGC